jgi:hypothetical protein
MDELQPAQSLEAELESAATRETAAANGTSTRATRTHAT